jgi:hypothetical protein
MYKNFSLTEKEKKQILEQHGRYGYKKPLKESFNDEGDPMMSQKQYNEEGFSDGGKFRISHAGVTVNNIKIGVELSEDYEGDDIVFTLKSDRDGNLTIVDFDNPSYGEIDDEEVKEYMESMIASGKINVPDFISFDPETGKVDRYN